MNYQSSSVLVLVTLLVLFFNCRGCASSELAGRCKTGEASYSELKDLSKLRAGAQAIRSHIYTEHTPSEDSLRDAYHGYVTYLIRAADILGVPTAGENSNWVGNLIDQYRSGKIRKENEKAVFLIQQALQTRSRLANFAGEATIKSIEQELPRRNPFYEDRFMGDFSPNEKKGERNEKQDSNTLSPQSNLKGWDA